MTKKLVMVFMLLAVQMFICYAFAQTQTKDNEQEILRTQSIQSRVNDIGSKLLNANKIEQRIVFVYNEKEKESFLTIDPSVMSREVILYDGYYQYTQNDDELAAYLARGILTAMKSYHGFFNGYLSALQIKAAPKKFEIVADKRAVDFMVNAGYNPLGLITFIQKSCLQSSCSARWDVCLSAPPKLVQNVTEKIASG